MKRINTEPALTFDDVLLVPQYSSLLSRSEADTCWKLGPFEFTAPVVAANMDSICERKMMSKMAQLGGLGIHHRRCPVEDYSAILSWWKDMKIPGTSRGPLALSIGSIHADTKKIDWCVKPGNCDIICIDIAHGDSIHMLDTLTYIRDKGFTGPIIVGNVVTPEATRCLLEHGATMVKVGVGPGSVCTTRIKTGCGYPQLSAVMNCAEAGPIIADGGIRTPGDVAKALAAGAKAVMIGGMLAGTDCVPGWDEAWARHKEIGLDTPPRIVYRGMASKEARQAVGETPTNAEGVSKTVECKPQGSTEAVIIDIIEGVSSAMSYSGALTLEEFATKSQFVRVTSTVQAENIPHFRG